MRVQPFVSPQLKAIYLSQTTGSPGHEDSVPQDRVVEGHRLQTDLMVRRPDTANKPPDRPGPSTLTRIGDAVASGLTLSLVGAVGGAFADMFFSLGQTFDSVISLGAIGGAGQGPWLAIGAGAAIGGLAGVLVGYHYRQDS